MLKQGRMHVLETINIRVVIHTGKKAYMHPLTSNLKETDLSDYLNNGIEWVFRDCGRYLKHAKDPLPLMGNMVEFDMRTDLEGLNNNLKLSYALVNFRTSSKKWSQITGMCFLSMDSTSLSGYFHSIFTKVTIHPYNENTQIRPT